MIERHLADQQVLDALEKGERIRQKEDDYLIKWNRWRLAVSIGRCSLVLKTAFRT
jgi:hypothetical protein